MALLQIYRDTIFLEAVLAIDILQEPQPNLGEKNNPSILKDDFFSQEQTHPFSHH